MYQCVPVCVLTCASVCQCVPACASVCQCVPVCASVCVPVCLPVCLPVCRCVCLRVCSCVSLRVPLVCNGVCGGSSLQCLTLSRAQRQVTACYCCCSSPSPRVLSVPGVPLVRVQVGEYCDAEDQYHVWYESVVLEDNGSSLKIHFMGWD